MPTKYILIDFENVQPEIPPVWKNENVKVKVFLGAKPKNLAPKFVTSAHALGLNLEYVEFSQQGKNALDFFISFWLGRLSQSEPAAEFEIVSNDKGFDPLICQLQKESLRIVRTGQVGSQKDSAIWPMLYDSKIQSVVAKLRGTTTKPRTLGKLQNMITCWLGKLTTAEMNILIAGLQEHGAISISDFKVTYTLSKKPHLRVA